MHILSSSGNTHIDTITADAIASFEAQFPNGISGYYFQGSCADQATTALSDIDLHVVFQLPPTDAEQCAVAELRTTLQQRSPRPLHTYCRVRWDYHVPAAAADRAILRELCQHELAFENHFLTLYKDFLHHEQSADDVVARQFAAERLRSIG